MEEEEEVVLVEEEEEDTDVEDCLALLNDCINGLFVVVVPLLFRFFFFRCSRSFANSFRISMGNALKSDGSMESMVVGRNEEDEEEEDDDDDDDDEEETLRKKC